MQSLLVDSDRVDLDLIESAAIDSADFMQLFLLLEEVFGIQVQSSDLLLDNFRTVDRMATFVLSKLADQSISD